MANIKAHHSKDGQLYYKVRVTNGRDINGKLIYKAKNFYPTAKEGTKKCEKELAAFVAEMEKQVHEGRFYDGNNMTYAVFARDVWKPQYAEKNLTESQRDQYWKELTENIFPSIGNMKLSKITGANCQDIINNMEKETSRRGTPLKPATNRRRFTIMKSVFNYAYKMSVIADNPCERCILPKIKHEEELRTFTEDQAVNFLQFLHYGYDTEIQDGRKHPGGTTSKGYTIHVEFPLWIKTYFHIALYGGLRRGEELALTWNDIDFENEETHINKAVKHGKNGVIVGTTKTESGIRTISLPSVCFDLLKQLYAVERELCLRSGNTWEGAPLSSFDKNSVFIKSGKDGRGQCMYLETPYKALKRVINAYNGIIDKAIETGTKDGTMSAEDIQREEKKKLPSLRLHDMRHTSATIQLAEGVDIETVKRRLGHAKASTTLDIYGHALKTRDKQASDTIGNALKSAKDEQERRKQATLPEMLTPDELELIKAYRNASTGEKQRITERLEKNDKPDVKAMA